MQIELLLFGITRDIVGSNSMSFELPEKLNIKDLKNLLSKKYPELDKYDYSIAVNETYASTNTIINNHDVVALIPPVSGG